MSDLPLDIKSSDQPKTVDGFIAAFGKLGLIGEEIADVIWLALNVQQYEPPYSLEENPPVTSESTKLDKSSKLPDSRPPKDSSNSSDNTPISATSDSSRQAEILGSKEQSGGESTGGNQDLAIRLPNARSLQEPLPLARALRPLFRRVSSTNMVLDEAATIERIAEEQLWTPVLKPDLEPWLELALVVDESKSMLLWQQTIRELQSLLERYGIFRDVRTWGMVIDQVVDKDGQVEEQVRIRPGIGNAARNQRPRSPGELIDPQGRRLVLIATDCVATHWHDGTVLSALKTWSQSGSTAIIQMLPEWLWSRTALGLAAPVRFRALLPGISSQRLQAKPLSAWDEIDFENGIQVPIITLEPEVFTIWSQLVAGKGGVWAPGFVFEPELFESDEEEESSSENNISAEQRVRGFYNSASPMAWKLASLLAAAPIICLPVVRIIQSELLPKSRQVHVAEVFLGGLLSPSQPLSEIIPDTNPDEIRYDFVEGVREALLESSLRTDSVNVLEVVSQFIDGRIGRSLAEFVAYLRDPNQIRDDGIQSKPIAIVTAQVLKKLGGEYARYAEKLEQVGESFDDSTDNNLNIELNQTDKILTHKWICESSFLAHQENITCVCVSSNGLIVSSSDDCEIRIWDLEGNIIATCRGHSALVHHIAISPDEQTIISGSADNTVRLWNLQGRPLGDSLRGHGFLVCSVAFSPDGRKIASGSADNTVRLWSLDGSSIGQPFRGHTDSILSVAFSPDGLMIASGSADNTVRLWSLDGSPIGTPFESHTASVNSIVFSPDGQTIASGSADNTLRLWSLDGSPIGTPFEGHTAYVWAVVFSPDGQFIVSGSRDKTIRLWNRNGTPIGQPLQGHEGGVNSVAFSPDGQMLVSCSSDRSIKLWRKREQIKTILILSSNPRRDLNLDREISDLSNAVKRLADLEVVLGLGVRSQELQELLAEHNPEIVHFVGHSAGEQGLFFEDEDGREQLVSSEILARIFRNFAEEIRCIVLHACDSDHQAEAIAEHIDYVVSVSQPILDQAAHFFSIGFYKGLAARKSIEQAYEMGCIAIQLWSETNSQSSQSRQYRKLEPVAADTLQLAQNQLPEHLKPILLKRRNSNPPRLPQPAEISTQPDVPAEFLNFVHQEIDRKPYKDQARVAYDNFGQYSGQHSTENGVILTKAEYSQRQVFLDKVKQFWIEGVLKSSLQGSGAMKLNFKNRPDLIADLSQGIEALSMELDASYEKLRTTQIYGEMGQGRTLLILGDPGDGKTIALLQLAQRLIDRSEQNLSLPIPVVLNLSSWAKERKSIVDWVIDELREKYQVPKSLSQPWITQQQLILLLDGLDEVKQEYRSNCVCALNEFIGLFPQTEVVVCSRVKDYEAMTEYLQISSAICLSASIKLFFSYAHKDEPLRGELAKHLTLLKRQNIITDWYDRNITAGTDWAQAIDDNLNTADIILLLISANFLASNYCYDKEMTRALERHNQGTARVIPIILRPCDWHSAPFGKLQALPKDAKPITQWSDQDAAFTNIAQGIRKAVEEL